MNDIIPNIEILLIVTGYSERCLIFMLPNESTSNDFYNRLINYNLLWYYNNENKLTIRIALNDVPNILTITLLKDLESYRNVDWLLNHEVNVISVGYYDALGKLVYNLPLPLNYQSPE